ncbi:MAG: succinylglutamate desuccinylase/aspartoacylase family protein [Candidatus Competibacterales bacterium]
MGLKLRRSGPRVETFALHQASNHPKTLTVYRFGTSGARPKAYLQGGLHADEFPGILTLHHLMAALEEAQSRGALRGEVVVVPVANPLGLDQWVAGRLLGRFDLDSGVNFNRRFPDLTAKAQYYLSSPPASAGARDEAVRSALRRAAQGLRPRRAAEALKARLLQLAVDADLVLDLHCDSEALVHLYSTRRQEALAAALGRDLGAAVVLLEDEPGGSPFDAAVASPWGQLERAWGVPLGGVFAATVELRGQRDVGDDLAYRDAQNLYRFLVRRGVIHGPPPLDPVAPTPVAPEPLVAPLEGVDLLTAPRTGITVFSKRLGDWIAKDEVVAEVIDPHCPRTPRQAVRSRTEGRLFARNGMHFTSVGQNLGKVAGRDVLAHRRPGQLLDD